MNRYCIDLNFNNTHPLKSQDIVDKLLIEKKKHSMLDFSYISDTIVSALDELGLYIKFAETFYKVPNNNWTVIHTDGKFICDHIKINWEICQGSHSLMHWYTINGNKDDAGSLQVSPGGSFNRHFSKDEITHAYSAKVGFPSMVQAGVPHYVTTGLHERLCISIGPYSKVTKKSIPWDTGLEIFKRYII